MKTLTNNKTERVEVMALFGYEMTPCQPLSFRRRDARRWFEANYESLPPDGVATRVKPKSPNCYVRKYVLRGRWRFTFSTFWLAGTKCG